MKIKVFLGLFTRHSLLQLQTSWRRSLGQLRHNGVDSTNSTYIRTIYLQKARASSPSLFLCVLLPFFLPWAANLPSDKCHNWCWRLSCGEIWFSPSWFPWPKFKVRFLFFLAFIGLNIFLCLSWRKETFLRLLNELSSLKGLNIRLYSVKCEILHNK